MRKHIGIMFIFAISLILIPCIAFFNMPDTKTSHTRDSVKVLLTKTGEVSEINLEDYLIGAVLAQMPADFEEEALKAQAILAHTYILRRQLAENENPTKKLNGADISDDSTLYQAYFTENEAKAFYDNEYENAYNKVSKAVKAVENQVLTYDSQPIIVAFHAISCGKTQTAKDFWGEDISYLTSVDSDWDKQVDGFEATTKFTLDELVKKLEAVFSEVDFSQISDKLEITSTTDSGAVLTVTAGDNEITGTDFASALDIPSPCFTIDIKDDVYTFTSKGYGHLIGMSQYGANLMAQEGSSYTEILTHYFTGTKIQKN